MSIFTREMIEAAVEQEYGETFIHWRHEFDRWLDAEADRRADDRINDLVYTRY